MTPSESHAIKTLKELDESGSAGTITTESCGPDKKYQVVAKFRTLQQMQAFHQAMIECGRAVRSLEEPDEHDLKAEEPVKGPLSHDTGGGKRNIRSTRSLS